MPDSNYYKRGNRKGGPGPATGPSVSSGGSFVAPEADEKLAALLSYLVGWISGLLFYFAGKSRYVKFHAMQAIIIFGTVTLFQLAIQLIRKGLTAFLPLTGSLYSVLNLFGMVSASVWVGALVLWAFLMAKAYQGETYRFPVAGEIAAKKTDS